MPDLPPLDLDPTPALGRSDAELITAVRAGDNEAYGVLFDRHVGAARSLSRQLTRDPNEGDDLVSEAFAKVLAILQGGGGPDVAFRAYLLTSVRRVAYDRTRATSRVQVTDDLEPYDSGEEFVDPAVAGLERTIVSRAYSSLPERWQTVLWHTEVEGLSPAEIAPLLGLTANGVAALAYRAREGLRQAYLQQHVMGQLTDGCRPFADRLGAYARGGLSRRENAQVEAHLEHCEDCRALVLELTDVNHGMRAVVAPLVLGLVLAGYLEGLSVFGGTAAATGTAGASTASGTASSGGVAAGSTTAAGAATGTAGTGAAAAAAAVATATAGVAAGTPAAAAAASTVLAGAASGGGLLAGGWVAAAAAAVVGLATVGVTVALVTGGEEPGTTARGPAASAPQLPGLAPTSPGAPTVPGGGTGSTASEPAATAAPSEPTLASAAPSQTASLVPSPTASPSPMPSESPTPSASPSPSPSVSPSPTPSGSPTPTPSPSASESPSPSPTPPAPSAALTVALEPLGDLVAGRTGLVGLTVTNTGDGGSTPLTATVTLPPGVTYQSVQAGARVVGRAAVAIPDDHRWSCTATADGAVCDRPSLPPGRSSRLVLAVRAAAGSAGGVPVRISVGAKGEEPVVVTGERGVQAGGLSARFSAIGPLAATEAGNALLSCPDAAPGCAAARMRLASGAALDNDAWAMTWFDADADPTTYASSAAQLPEGDDVVWAGLYWSAAWDGKTDPAAVRLRGPAERTYRVVTADQVDTDRARLFPVYQSFADVTAQVRAGGAGTWWVADPVARTGAGAYAGWALVVVRAVPGAADAPVTVLDGLTAVRQGADPVSTLLPAVAAERVHLGTVAWEGDAGARGDSITLDGVTLTPLGGFRDAGNVADSSASGALGPSLTFGTDVDEFLATVTAGRPAELAARSGAETFFLGVVTVSGT